ncbi:MAG: polyprenyl synthetase family protein [Sphaerochaeta sp.]|uniref:polyprenyl synthetase family protein n=1 Tax=Sphaerochaeta sp. TaxID=1972642 RepID=UPI002FC5EF55
MADFWNDEPTIQSHLSLVSATIEQTVANAHGFIRQVLLDHVKSGGKMLRPALVMITSKLGEHEIHDDAVRVGSIIEMIHLASLVHDDIIDTAEKRRGQATVFARVGAKQAVLAGDFLLAKALVLTSGKERGIDSRVVSSAFARLCESELDQDAGQGNFFISRRNYLRRIAGKTASLFALSCYAGAALQEGDPLVAMRCHRIGYCLGMAFQIQDDILDYTGSADKLGKQTGNDLRCGIPTLPLLYALEAEQEQGNDRLRSLLENVQAPLHPRTVKQALVLTDELGGVQKAQLLAESYKNRAFADIRLLNHPEVERQLTNLFTKLSTRSV